MNDEHTFELLSAAADGDLSDSEKQELDRLVSESTEARELQAQLNRLEDIMAAVPDLDPPATLGDDIIQKASLPKPRGKALWSLSDSLPDWLHPIQWSAVMRYGVSTAFGALLIVALYESQPNYGPSANITEMVGTMAANVEGVNLAVVDRFSFDATGISSIARLELRDGALVLDIRIDTKDFVEVTVDFENTGLEVEALAQTNSNFESIEFANQILRIKGRGQRRFAVLLRTSDDTPFAGKAEINLEYSSNGNLLQQGSLRSTR